MKKLTIAIAALSLMGLSFNAQADGKKTYDTACGACHNSGAAGAPKLTDKAGWKARLAQGNAVLYTSAIKGKGSMPAKGGRSNLSDDVVKAAVDYMLSQVK